MQSGYSNSSGDPTVYIRVYPEDVSADEEGLLPVNFPDRKQNVQTMITYLLLKITSKNA